MARAAVVRLADRRSTPRSAVVNAAIEAQALLREYRKGLAPMWAAAMSSGDWELMAQVQDLAATLDSSRRALRRIAARSEAIACADGVVGLNHGRAA